MNESSAEYQKVMSYIDAHPAAVVSTTNDDGTPQASVVYAFTVSHHTVCFVTRNLTHKYQNIFERPEVAVTIFDERDISTLQATGTAFVATDEHMLSYVMNKVEELYKVRGDSTSPIDKMQHAGDYVLIGIEINKAKLTLYQGIDVNIDRSFTEISIGGVGV